MSGVGAVDSPGPDSVRPVSLPPISLLIPWIRLRLSSEALAAVAVAAVAVATRLWGLGDRPLQPAEAEMARQWWDMWTARNTQPLLSSPLLAHLQTLIFALFGASDTAARLGPALAGTAVALSPWLFRPMIGERAASAAGLLLALSPLAVHTSRLVDSSSLLALAMAAVLASAWRALVWGERPWAAVLGASFALAMSADSWAVPMLVGVAGAFFVLLVGAKRHLGQIPGWDSSWTSRFTVGVAVAVVVADTAFLSNLAGMGKGLVSVWSDWLIPFQGARSGPLALSSLLAYDWPLLLLALLGSGLCLLRNDTFGSLVSWWAFLALGLAGLAPFSEGRYLAQAAPPLAILGGVAMASYPWTAWIKVFTPRGMVGLCGVAVVAGFLMLTLAKDIGAQLAVPYVVAAGVGVGFLVWMGAREARAAGILALIGLAALEMLSANTRLSWSTFPERGQMPGVVVSPPDLRIVTRQLEVWSRQDPDPVILIESSLKRHLAWYVRDLPNVSYQNQVPEATPRSVRSAPPEPDRSPGRRVGREVRWEMAEPISGLATMTRWWLQGEGLVRPVRYDIIVTP